MPGTSAGASSYARGGEVEVERCFKYVAFSHLLFALYLMVRQYQPLVGTLKLHDEVTSPPCLQRRRSKQNVLRARAPCITSAT